jgi:hypothetical protein
MSSNSKSAIIRDMYAGYLSKDRGVVERLLTDGFRFTSPYDDAIDKDAYFRKCWPNSERMGAFDIEKILEQGAEAFITYKIRNHDGKEFSNTEFFRFDGDKVRSIDVYFGATYQDDAFVKQQQ